MLWIALRADAYQVVEALRMLWIDGDAGVEVLVSFLIPLRGKGRKAFREVLLIVISAIA